MTFNFHIVLTLQRNFNTVNLRNSILRIPGCLYFTPIFFLTLWLFVSVSLFYLYMHMHVCRRMYTQICTDMVLSLLYPLPGHSVWV